MQISTWKCNPLKQNCKYHLTSFNNSLIKIIKFRNLVSLLLCWARLTDSGGRESWQRIRRSFAGCWLQTAPTDETWRQRVCEHWQAAEGYVQPRLPYGSWTWATHCHGHKTCKQTHVNQHSLHVHVISHHQGVCQLYSRTRLTLGKS